MSAAYVANVLETMKAVRDKLPSATYVDHLDDAQEELDAIRPRSAEIKEYVAQLRRLRRQSRSPVDKARILSNDGSFAGAWLFTVPVL